MNYIYLGDLAKEQELRHPPENGAATGRRKPRSPMPLVLSGRPSTRFRAKEGAEGATEEVPMVSRSAFGRFSLIPGELRTVRLRTDGRTSGTVASGRLREGDVVISLAEPFQAAYVGPGAGAYVSAGFAIIRMDEASRETLDPAYLTAWLSMPYVAETLLPSKVQGRFMVLDDLYGLGVPLPPLRVQRDIGEMVMGVIELDAERRADAAAEDAVMRFMVENVTTEVS